LEIEQELELDLGDGVNNDDNIEFNSVDNKNTYLEKVFSKIKEGDLVYAISLDAMQKATKPPHARYTEASIIKKLDDLGIGRPSTYASMIKKVQEEQRQYVEKKNIIT